MFQQIFDCYYMTCENILDERLNFIEKFFPSIKTQNISFMIRFYCYIRIPNTILQCQETLSLKLSFMHVQKHILHAFYLNEKLVIFAQLCCYNNNESAELKYKNDCCNEQH